MDWEATTYVWLGVPGKEKYREWYKFWEIKSWILRLKVHIKCKQNTKKWNHIYLCSSETVEHKK